MSKHDEFCLDAHERVCHVQAHRENPERPFVYQSPIVSDIWRVAVIAPDGYLHKTSTGTRAKALKIASEFAKGDYRSAA